MSLVLEVLKGISSNVSWDWFEVREVRPLKGSRPEDFFLGALPLARRWSDSSMFSFSGLNVGTWYVPVC